MSTYSNRARVFIGYSQNDKKYLDRLKTHFAYYQRQGMVDIWDDTKLAPGSLWHEEIKQAILQTKVAVLLVSADFLASKFIAENILPPLLAAAQTDGAIIIPVILSACAFEDTELARFQAINSSTKPISSMNRDEKENTWAAVAQYATNAIRPRQVAQNYQMRPPMPPLANNKDFTHETRYAQQLIINRPLGWEYLLTAELLSAKLVPVKQQLSDLQRGLLYRKSRPLTGDSFISWAQGRCNDLTSLIGVATTIINVEIPRSWGPPGIEGDPLIIKQTVEKLIFVCNEMVSWENDVHFVAVPKQLERLRKTMEGWTTDFIYQIDSIPNQLRAIFAHPNPKGTYEIKLVFAPPANIQKFVAELRGLKFKKMIFGKAY